MKIETGTYIGCTCDIDHGDGKYKISFGDEDILLCKKCFKELKSILG